MVAIAILSILTTFSVASYRYINNKSHLNEAKQALLKADQQYHLYQLVNPYLLDDLNHNIQFESNNDYHFQIEENKTITSFIALKNNSLRKDPCTKLILNTNDETQAFDFSGKANEKCWQ